MTIYEDIESEIRDQYAAGATYKQMSEKTGISLQHLQRLNTQQETIPKMSLETLFKLFPDAALFLHGAPPPTTITGSNIATGNTAPVTQQIGTPLTSDQLTDLIINSELDPAKKITLLTILRAK